LKENSRAQLQSSHILHGLSWDSTRAFKVTVGEQFSKPEVEERLDAHF
jgi:hypothetical protein